jgi:hypothetical protein
VGRGFEWEKQAEEIVSLFDWTNAELESLKKLKMSNNKDTLLHQQYKHICYCFSDWAMKEHHDEPNDGVHQSPGYFDHVLEVIVIIFKTYFENDQNILTSSSSMGFLPIKLMI